MKVLMIMFTIFVTPAHLAMKPDRYEYKDLCKVYYIREYDADKSQLCWWKIAGHQSIPEQHIEKDIMENECFIAAESAGHWKRLVEERCR